MGYILETFKNTQKAIFKHRIYFIILFFTQIAFIIAISAIFANYALEFSESAQKVIEPMGELTDQRSIMDQDLSGMMAAYDQMISSVMHFLLFSFIVYIIFNGINWDLSLLIVNDKEKFMRTIAQFGIFTLIFGIPALFLISIISRIVLSLNITSSLLVFISILLIIVSYFMHISFSLIHEYKIREIKHHIKRTFSMGIRKTKHLVPVYLINLTAIAGFFALVALAADKDLGLSALTIIAFVLVMNITRLYFITAVKKEL
ncbi:hypothetical protein GF336_03490 [Candidatus Woesearchaeota archaeon]|nr:hypothetical protein [Candidatus Woesearchaeota archaeon]